MSEQSKQEYRAARQQLQDTIRAFVQSAAIDTYLEAKRQVVAEYLEAAYPEMTFILNPIKRCSAQPTSMEMAITIDITVFPGQAQYLSLGQLHAEVSAYLDGLDSEPDLLQLLGNIPLSRFLY